MNDALATFFNILGEGDGVGFFFGLLSLYVSACIVIFLIDPIIE